MLPRAITTNYHTHFFSPKSEVSNSGTMWDTMYPKPVSCFLGVINNLWHILSYRYINSTSICITSTWYSLKVPVDFHIAFFFLCIRTLVTGFRNHANPANTLLILSHLYSLFPNTVTFIDTCYQDVNLSFEIIQLKRNHNIVLSI